MNNKDNKGSALPLGRLCSWKSWIHGTIHSMWKPWAEQDRVVSVCAANVLSVKSFMPCHWTGRGYPPFSLSGANNQNGQRKIAEPGFRNVFKMI